MAQKPPYLRKLAKHGDIAVWIVDGSYIRGHMDEEFASFGQHHPDELHDALAADGWA